MSDIEFKAGDVVRLKSGGPLMTVEQTGTTAMLGEEAVWCVWFEKTKKHNATFSPSAVEKVEKPKNNIGSPISV